MLVTRTSKQTTIYTLSALAMFFSVVVVFFGGGGLFCCFNETLDLLKNKCGP